MNRKPLKTRARRVAPSDLRILKLLSIDGAYIRKFRIFPHPPTFDIVYTGDNGNLKYDKVADDIVARLVRHGAISADGVDDTATLVLTARGWSLLGKKGAIEAATVLPELFGEEVPYRPQTCQMEWD